MRPADMWYSPHTGKVVSRAKQGLSRNMYAASKFAIWNRCLAEARRILGYQGRFVPVKGKTVEGMRLWETAKALQRLHG